MIAFGRPWHLVLQALLAHTKTHLFFVLVVVVAEIAQAQLPCLTFVAQCHLVSMLVSLLISIKSQLNPLGHWRLGFGAMPGMAPMSMGNPLMAPLPGMLEAQHGSSAASEFEDTKKQ